MMKDGQQKVGNIADNLRQVAGRAVPPPHPRPNSAPQRRRCPDKPPCRPRCAPPRWQGLPLAAPAGGGRRDNMNIIAVFIHKTGGT